MFGLWRRQEVQQSQFVSLLMAIKTLDQKLAALASDPQADVFILADAKDADMGFGLAATGPNFAKTGPTLRTLNEYRQQMREIASAAEIDIMLMSPSSNEKLHLQERMFESSAVTPAVRANDSTDIWLGLSASYRDQPALPFRSATLDHLQCGHLGCSPEELARGTNLGLYSITLNNDAVRDRETLEQYQRFRWETEPRQFRHFLEVFAPNASRANPIPQLADFVNDSIARILAGVTQIGRPLFLKIPFLGTTAMKRLVRYDDALVVGILGGSSGTTRDAYQLVETARRAGARAALFGRKINQAEDQIQFVHFLRQVADAKLDAISATKAYHQYLSDAAIEPNRSLRDDLDLTDAVLMAEDD